MSQGSIDLTPVVRAVERAVSQVDYHVSQVEGQVGKVRDDLGVTTRELLELKQQFELWVGEARRTAAVQRAETTVGNLKAELDRQFGHYRIVRRSSVGTLEALDLGLVTNNAVQQVSEQLMIQTPKYWLAPALVALAAWSRDDQELANRAVDESYARDRSKCSLFFALVLQRQGRLDGATRWTRHYLRSLDPHNLPREFAVILEALARGGFGLQGRELIQTQLDDWLTMLRDDPQKVAEQVELWRRDLGNYAGSIPANQFTALRENCPTWGVVQQQIVAASALGNAASHYQAILDTKVEVSTDVLARMDDLLDILVREYDGEELPLRRQVSYQEAVIEYDGDLDRARAKAELDDQAMAESIDALLMQTYTAMMPELLGVSVQTQVVSIGALKAEFRQAVTSYTKTYRYKATNRAEIVLGPQHTNAAIQFGFPGWKTTTTTPQVDAEHSLERVWEETMDKLREQLTFKGSSMVLPVIIGLIVAFISLSTVIIPLLAIGAVAFYWWRKKTKADAEVAAVDAKQAQALAVSIDRYRTTMAEFTDALLTYEDADAKESDILALIDGWPSASLREAAA